ncbi:MAG: KUP/HAK/KT family potassium transporter [Bacteroidia bacterium]|nr:KUP/HAK/KT family potassium transporter [Bacteroidia bacterium]MCX7652734.1 KUP/HAK/KT family potassium transporter [Bacteroidia bacterium]MDW8416382.1 KUP/HAK/KT family potassium transporter [Bacteroidia bacterium]
MGIVFGDIGTSPLYALDALVRGKPISEPLVLGGLSLIFWTLTLIVSVKYIVLVMRADNHGEGGIFAMYSLLRHYAPWIVPLVIIGASMTFADSIFTPAISVSSAIEGLELHIPNLQTVPIVVAILIGLFLIQQFGTEWIGKLFGPIMLLWFGFIGGVGAWRLLEAPQVLSALNPLHAVHLLKAYPEGFLVLGAVFLAVTGVEALYADMGHVGRDATRLAWLWVKPALLLSYFGQGAWMLTHRAHAFLGEAEKPFFAMLPEGWLFIGVGISTAATIIASQALITGAYTVFSEANRLGFWPRMKVLYPATTRAQMYVPLINWTLLGFVLLIVLTMRRSSAMEAAYGLSINITLLITSILLATFFWWRLRALRGLGPLLLLIFLPIELFFLYSNLHKVPEGGWIALALGGGIALVMSIWLWGERVKRRFSDFVEIEPYVERLIALSEETELPYFATHLVCLTTSPVATKLEHRLLYVLLQRQPKRARTYWFVHVAVSDSPYEAAYQLHTYAPGKLYRVDFYIGFKLQPRLGLLLRQVISRLAEKNEIDLLSPYPHLRSFKVQGDFRFLFVRRIINWDGRFSPRERLALQLYQLLDKMSLGVEGAYGIEVAALTQEQVPLTTPEIPPELRLRQRAS